MCVCTTYVQRLIGRIAAIAPAQKTRNGGAGMVWRLAKLVLLLVCVGFIGLTGYAYFGDLSPQQREVTQPVTLDAP
jgi:hypothetical protein